MELFSKETINRKRKGQTRELAMKNDRLAVSLRKLLQLQNDIDFDADKAQKVKEYQIWCEDVQTKQGKVLAELRAYEKLLDEKKERYYELVAQQDSLEDSILDKQEESGRLELELTFKRELLAKQ